jgi:hypothetical protein
MSKAYSRLCQVLLPAVALAALVAAFSDAAPLTRQYYTDERGVLRRY